MWLDHGGSGNREGSRFSGPRVRFLSLLPPLLHSLNSSCFLCWVLSPPQTPEWPQWPFLFSFHHFSFATSRSKRRLCFVTQTLWAEYIAGGDLHSARKGHAQRTQRHALWLHETAVMEKDIGFFSLPVWIWVYISHFQLFDVGIIVSSLTASVSSSVTAHRLWLSLEDLFSPVAGWEEQWRLGLGTLHVLLETLPLCNLDTLGKSLFHPPKPPRHHLDRT